MELRQLTYFEAVARLGGFSRAAEQLRIAQPAVSAQIRNLERELGTTLFERTTRRVTLTHAGELLLVRARAVLAEVQGARADLDQLAGVLRGRLSIGATPVLGSLDLPAELAGFHRRYPELTITTRTGLVADLLSGLADGDIDVVLGPVHDDLPERYRAQRLVGESLVLITPPDGAGAGTTTLAAHRDRPFVCLPAGSGLRSILTRAAADEGFTPRVPFEAPDPAGIRALVAAGMGVALLAESAATADGPPVAVRRLKAPPRHPPIGLIRLRDRAPTPAVRAWQRHLTRPG
jgi:DNA-binding transcriptional LysR family regulator